MNDERPAPRSDVRQGAALQKISPDEALARLAAGNERFVRGASEHPRTGPDRRIETARGGQHPFATVLTCSDSRCPVELLFDSGIGDLFVIRVAGNVCDFDETGSIEFGVGHLKTPLLVVLGHTHCGAVTAVVTGAILPGSIPRLVAPIKPAMAVARRAHPELAGDALVGAVIKANVLQSMRNILRRSAEVRKRVRASELDVLGAIYDIETGLVEWLGPHPGQTAFLAVGGGSGATPPDHSLHGDQQ